MAKKNNNSGKCAMDYTQQVERYPGCDVLGMEYTTARPIAYETGANPPVTVPEPNLEPGQFIYWAHVKGLKVMR